MEKCNITECLLNKNGECACSSRQAGRCDHPLSCGTDDDKTDSGLLEED